MPPLYERSALYEKGVRAALRAYKLTLSPVIGRQCRFLPTCSEYAAEALIAHGPVRGGCLADGAIQRHGLWAGGWMGAGRLCRCHPWAKSGYDPVPPPKSSGLRRTGGGFTCES